MKLMSVLPTANVEDVAVTCVPAGAPEPFFDHLCHCEVESAKSMISRDHPLLWRIDVSVDMLPVDRLEAANTMLNILGQGVLRLGATSGFVDLGSFVETRSGHYFGTWLESHSNSLCRMIQKQAWEELGAAKRSQMVRGVYWGNYFGPDIVNRVGGANKLRTSLEHVVAHVLPHRKDLFEPCVILDNGGAVVRLSELPQSCLQSRGDGPDDIAVRLGGYLHGMLRTANLLC